MTPRVNARSALRQGPAALIVLLGMLPLARPAVATAATGAPDCAATMKSVVDQSGAQVGQVDARQPVLLIHGLNGSPTGTWNGPDSLASQLQADGGYFVGRFDYQYANHAWVTDPAISGTSATPGKLADVIYCMAQQSRAAGGSGKVILVGYSMGGLAAQQAISEKVGNQQIATDIGGLASIGTPWRGTINPALGQTAGGAGQALHLPILDTAICNLYSFSDRALLRQIPGEGCYAAGAPGSPGWQAQVLNLDGSLPRQMKKLPPLPAGFPVFAVAGDVHWQSDVFGQPRDHSGSDGVTSTGSATSPPLATPGHGQVTSAIISCGKPPAAGSGKKSGSVKSHQSEYYGALTLLAPGCGHGALPNSAATASTLTPELAFWRLSLAQAAPASIAGTYVFTRTVTSCVAFQQGCNAGPLTLQISCPANQCTVTRTDIAWQYRHPLAFDGTTWHAAGPEGHATSCNNQFAPGTIKLDLQIESVAVVNHQVKAQQLQGTLTETQPAGTCSNYNPGGSVAVYALSNQPAASPAVPPAPASLSRQVKTALAAATSVHIAAALTGSSTDIKMDMNVAGQNNMYGTLTVNNTPFTVLGAGGSTYLRATAAVLAKLKLPAARCPVVCGDYLKIASASALGLPGPGPWSLVGALKQDVGQAGSVTAATLNGLPCWKVKIPGGTAYVAAQGPAFPLRVIEGGNSIDFSQWDGAAVPPPPPSSLIISQNQLRG
jgi:pimeloyl-ACP methyl ester carboxylesterase